MCVPRALSGQAWPFPAPAPAPWRWAFVWRWGPSWQDTSPRGCPRPTRLVETGQGWLGDAAQRLEGPSWPSVRVYQAPTAWRVREHAARRSPALGVRSMPAVPTARAGPCLRPRPRSQGPPQGPWAPHAPGPPGQDPPAPGCSRTPSWPSCSHAGLSRRRPSSSVPSRLSAEARPRPPLLPSPLLCFLLGAGTTRRGRLLLPRRGLGTGSHLLTASQAWPGNRPCTSLRGPAE